MTAPTRAEWGSCWLGRYTDPTADGWLNIREPVQDAQLAVFERKVTIGDASKDTDDYISSWVMGDWSGGGQIEDINESSDANRFWWGIAETRSPNRIALPPLATAARPGGMVGDAYFFPLGDTYTTASVLGPHAVLTITAGGTVATYGYFPDSDTWTSASATSVYSSFAGRGVSFEGSSGSYPLLYVPGGTSGYSTVYYNGTIPVVSRVATGAGIPKARAFCSFNTGLFCIDFAGRIWQTTNGTSWSKVVDFVQADVRLPPPATPLDLISYFNRTGEPTLHVVTDRDVWALDLDAGRIQRTTLQFPAHAKFGSAAAVFRPGEDLWIGAGMDTIRYTSANVIVPLAGPARDDGVPKDRLGYVADLLPELSCLYAAVTEDADGVENSGNLMGWTGTGWHGVSLLPYAPSFMNLSLANDGAAYHLLVGANSTTPGMYSFPLRKTFHNAKQGVVLGTDKFAASGYVETGRFDANMLGFRKVASHVSVFMDNATATETLVVKYRTDASQASFPTEGAWTTLGTIGAIGLTQIAFDPNGDGFKEGVSFNWIQFRLESARGATTSTSPLLNAFVLHFTKVPQNTPSLAFDLILPVETSVGATGDEMTDRLNGLVEADEYLCFVVRDRQYRVRIAGMSGNRATGEDGSGARKVSLIAIPEGL